jgi:phenylpropionate dioxygenase-like ring-hydroxylating dioxygenase large terminal subunit
MENALDVAHAPFVHAGSFGDKDRPQIAEFTVENYPTGAGATVMSMRHHLKVFGAFWHQSNPQQSKLGQLSFCPILLC